MSDVNVVHEEQQSSASSSFVIRMVANVLGKLIDRNTNIQVIVHILHMQCIPDVCLLWSTGSGE
jgi:hypothetical protein